MNAPRRSISYATYLRESPDWDVKHEWVNGEAYAMAGGSARHAAVTLNVGVALASRLRGTRCRATSSDQRVYIGATGASFHPDVTVVCGRYMFVDPDTRHVIHHTRHEDGWLRRDLEDGDIIVGSLGITLPLDELYVDLDALD